MLVVLLKVLATALDVELMGVIPTIELAYDKHWNQLWIECDSRLVTLAPKSLIALSHGS
ncbi:hypothetical protein L195_g061474 [Trifolium pratense]|uniref:Uncharacterized protein n=1 Tax=Trifolium pratense TaxID=57577 RepID=A0A2K3KA04_TRIPR|nr:hypothetical protein L195_g061474 [Trifolium pratense]